MNEKLEKNTGSAYQVATHRKNDIYTTQNYVKSFKGDA